MDGGGNIVSGLYVFENFILQIGSIQSLPFTLSVIIP